MYTYYSKTIDVYLPLESAVVGCRVVECCDLLDESVDFSSEMKTSIYFWLSIFEWNQNYKKWQGAHTPFLCPLKMKSSQNCSSVESHEIDYHNCYL